jgi:meso-butanediol dehydrogenase / (S,S)-butanediol dehydrogenase / diacetyl reductase
MRFRDKVAFVTGAGTGIGKSIANRLGSEGARVVVTDLSFDWASSVAKEIKKNYDVDTLARRLDVTRNQEVGSAIESVWDSFGPIDLLINNAGVSTMNRVVDLSEEEWDFNMNVNAKGVFLVSRSALKRMLEHDYGKEKPKIVNTASMAGKYGAPFLAHYCASKFAVVGFTQSLALELAPYGITVNCVCPGYVQTSMQERELVWEGKLRGMTPDEVKKDYLAHVPLGRLETAEDVTNVVAFLCSRDSDYMTGQAINVSGGQALI